MLFQFSDENATYILEPITNEVVYNDDPNIMWIQVTRELLGETSRRFVDTSNVRRRQLRWSRTLGASWAART